jgi:hypothetical protein
VLLPTRAAARGEGAWGAWAPEMLARWGGAAHCGAWQALWSALFARLAKHDALGLVDWAALRPALCARLGRALALPAGGAAAAAPFGAAPPPALAALFAGEARSRAGSAAKAYIYLLGRAAPPPPAAPPAGVGAACAAAARAAAPGASREDEDPALAELEALAAVLATFYHPTNGGAWSPPLGSFLRAAARHLAKRLVAERAAAAGGGGGWTDSEDEAPGPGAVAGAAASPAAAAAADGADDEAGAAGAAGAGGAAAPAPGPGARRPLGRRAAARAAAALAALAARGQSSKDASLARASVFALATLAHVAPEAVLPGVAAHLETALSTVTAARQLGGAVQALALCARPLLLAGLPPPAAEGVDLDVGGGGAAAEGGAGAGAAPPSDWVGRPAARARGAAALAAALAATAAGVDANDPPKALAAFRLAAAALSSAGAFPRAEGELDGAPPPPGGALPLDVEAWAGELLERALAAIAALDAPLEARGGAAAGGRPEPGSFLLDADSMFRPAAELLFARLPPGPRAAAVRRVARFLLSETLASVTAEELTCSAKERSRLWTVIYGESLRLLDGGVRPRSNRGVAPRLCRRRRGAVAVLLLSARRP